MCGKHSILNYFDELINTLDAPFFHNVTRQEHILPISLESNDFDEELLSAPVFGADNNSSSKSFERIG